MQHSYSARPAVLRRLWRKPGWQVAALFTIGSILFVVSGVAGLVTPIGNPTNPTPGGASAPAGLIGWPNAVAANLFFFPAGLIQVRGSGWVDRWQWLQVGGWNNCNYNSNCAVLGLPTAGLRLSDCQIRLIWSFCHFCS